MYYSWKSFHHMLAKGICQHQCFKVNLGRYDMETGCFLHILAFCGGNSNLKYCVLSLWSLYTHRPFISDGNWYYWWRRCAGATAPRIVIWRGISCYKHVIRHVWAVWPNNLMCTTPWIVIDYIDQRLMRSVLDKYKSISNRDLTKYCLCNMRIYI